PPAHHAFVCPLFSSPPWRFLGLPPTWYKSSPYRSRRVMDPGGVLRELGLAPPAEIEVRVWDSNAASRYLVLPERPPGTASLSEADLTRLVTPDAMIGVPKFPSPRPAAAP